MTTPFVWRTNCVKEQRVSGGDGAGAGAQEAHSNMDFLMLRVNTASDIWRLMAQTARPAWRRQRVLHGGAAFPRQRLSRHCRPAQARLHRNDIPVRQLPMSMQRMLLLQESSGLGCNDSC